MLPAARLIRPEGAQAVRTQDTGWWLFKRTIVVGRPEFEAAWRAAVVEERDFGYSGFVLGNYLDAQEQINGVSNSAENSPAARALANVFTAAFSFEQRRDLPDPPENKLVAWCREEYGEEGEQLVAAILAAHRFFRDGLEAIAADRVAVFLIK